jgi:hypothetical protein
MDSVERPTEPDPPEEAHRRGKGGGWGSHCASNREVTASLRASFSRWLR